jgi:hypothetical protein
VSTVASFIPELARPVSRFLKGWFDRRDFDRVRDTLVVFAKDLKRLRSETERYVESDDFAKLLEVTARMAFEEHSEAKRRLYQAFLAGAAQLPSARYADHVRMLRVLEQLRPQHVRVLRAMYQEPPVADDGLIGTPLHALQRRLPAARGARSPGSRALRPAAGEFDEKHDPRRSVPARLGNTAGQASGRVPGDRPGEVVASRRPRAGRR